MTRLETAGEPSMEDILASIRKIIAEDPPGSRAMPEPRAEPVPASVAERIFQRMSEPARSEPAKPAATNEPYLRNVMPSLSSTPVVAPPAEAVKPFDTTAKPFDIDAQMAEVLSKTRGAAPRRDVEPSFQPAAPQVQAALDSLALDSLTRAPAFSASPSPEQRPGFTVARDGFVPDAPGKATLNAPGNALGNDPFEFSLGPSPFASRSASQPSRDTSMPDMRDTRFQDFGTLVPTRPFASEPDVAAAPVAAKLDNTGASNAAPADAVPAAPAVESAVTAPVDETVSGAPSPESPSPEAIAATLKDFENAIIGSTEAKPSVSSSVASVDAVLAELQSKLEQTAAPEMPAAITVAQPEPDISSAPVELAAAADAVTAEVAASPIIDAPAADIVAIDEPAPIAAPEIVREFVRETAQDIVVADPINASHASHSTSPFPVLQNSAMLGGLPGARSMEDTVAELLRPMLRSWLAENMPKIVERALRKEIDDSLHSEHKTAAE